MTIIENLYIKNRKSLLNQAFNLTRDTEESKDLVQDTFIKAMNAINNGQYTESSLSSAWLSTILRNIYLDSYRKTSKVELHKDNYFKTVVIIETNSGESSLDSQDIENLLSTLPDKSASIIRLLASGCKFKDVAEELNMPENTVKTHYFYNSKINKIREKLKAY